MSIRTEADKRFDELAAEISLIAEECAFATVNVWAGPERDGPTQLKIARGVAGIIHKEFGYGAEPVLMPAYEGPADLMTLLHITKPS